jgi:hypothetical protein
VREAYQAVKYRCVVSEQSRAEMMPGELHIHKICAYQVASLSQNGSFQYPRKSGESKKKHTSPAPLSVRVQLSDLPTGKNQGCLQLFSAIPFSESCTFSTCRDALQILYGLP